MEEIQHSRKMLPIPSEDQALLNYWTLDKIGTQAGLFPSRESFEYIKALSSFALSLSHIVKVVVTIQIEG